MFRAIVGLTRYARKNENLTNFLKKKLNIPWVQMFTSPALMAIVVARFSYECQMVIMQSFLPSYFRDVLNLDIETVYMSKNPLVKKLAHLESV
jgi:hypothetical protein